MNSTKGFAYCGLACCICQEDSCPGCRSEGCTGKDWCKNFQCARAKGFVGCWECNDFPCEGGMLDKLRIRTFAKYIKEHGEDALMARLEINEQSGIAYHYEGQLVGDYDAADTEEGIIRIIENGKLS
jgi:hypothetical protein